MTTKTVPAWITPPLVNHIRTILRLVATDAKITARQIIHPEGLHAKRTRHIACLLIHETTGFPDAQIGPFLNLSGEGVGSALRLARKTLQQPQNAAQYQALRDCLPTLTI